jgi:tetratricopeptide (TPR) repeat protein
MNRTVFAMGCVALLGLAPMTAQGQLAMQPSNVSVLVLPPVPGPSVDTAFAIQVGDAVRKRLEGKMRLKLRVVNKEKIAEALSSSGFSPDAILDDNGAQQLARFMNVDAYITGHVERNGVPNLTLRLVDNRRSGLSGWLTVKGEAGRDVENFANVVVDSLDNQVKAAEQARECMERRDKQEFGSAQERADRAFRMYPNHPSAAMCLVSIYEARRMAPDSQIVMLKRALSGDSMLARAHESLARQYQAKGDTLAWAESFVRMLEANPTDMTRRLAAAELLGVVKRHARAVELLEEGLRRNPGDEQAAAGRARWCFEGQLWGCAADALGDQYEANAQLQADSMYLMQLLAVTQFTNDPATIPGWDTIPAAHKAYYRTAPDSVAYEKWTGVAVQKFPNSVSFWRQRAAALRTMGKTNETLAALRRVAQLDQADFAARIQAAQILTERAGVTIDSLAKLTADTIALKANRAAWEQVATTALAPADTVLQEAEKLATEDTKVNVAVMYFTPASKLVSSKLRPDLAIQWLEKAISLDPKQQLYSQANFFMGLAYLYRLQALDLDGMQKRKDCAVVQELTTVVTKGKAAMTAGASVQQETANNLIGVFSRLQPSLPQLKQAYNCRF